MSVAKACTPSGPLGRAALIALLISGSICGCAGDLVLDSSGQGARLRERSEGWSIGLPSESETGAWQRVEAEGAELAFRNRDGALLAMARRCRASRAGPEMLARSLRSGSGRGELLSAGPIERFGASGWRQSWGVRRGSQQLRLRSVTLRTAGCLYDWLLVAPDPASFGRAEGSFESWWSSFEPAAAAAPGPGAGSARSAREEGKP